MFALKALGLSLASSAVSWIGTCRMLSCAGRGAPVDVPHSRSSHNRPTVRGGRIGLAFAVCLSLLVVGSRDYGVPRGVIGLFAIATVIVAAIGLWTDYRDPPSHWRLFLQSGAAGPILGGGMGLHAFQLPWGHNVTLWWAPAPLILFWMTGVTNLCSFIDGATAWRRAAASAPYYREQWAERRRMGDGASPNDIEDWPRTCRPAPGARLSNT